MGKPLTPAQQLAEDFFTAAPIYRTKQVLEGLAAKLLASQAPVPTRAAEATHITFKTDNENAMYWAQYIRSADTSIETYGPLLIEAKCLKPLANEFLVMATQPPAADGKLEALETASHAYTLLKKWGAEFYETVESGKTHATFMQFCAGKLTEAEGQHYKAIRSAALAQPASGGGAI